MNRWAAVPTMAGLTILAGCAGPQTAPRAVLDVGQIEPSQPRITTPKPLVEPAELVTQVEPGAQRHSRIPFTPVRGRQPGFTPPPRRGQQPGSTPPFTGVQPPVSRNPEREAPVIVVPVIVGEPGVGLNPGGQVQIVEGATATSYGVRISVSPSGMTSFQTPATSGVGQVPSGITSVLFRDVTSALPLQSLQIAADCPASAASVYVSYEGDLSPDLRCTIGQQGQNLLEDVNNVAHALGIVLPAG